MIRQKVSSPSSERDVVQQGNQKYSVPLSLPFLAYNWRKNVKCRMQEK